MRPLTTWRYRPATFAAAMVVVAAALVGCGSGVDSPVPTEPTPDTTAEESSDTGGP